MRHAKSANFGMSFPMGGLSQRPGWGTERTYVCSVATVLNDMGAPLEEIKVKASGSTPIVLAFAGCPQISVFTFRLSPARVRMEELAFYTGCILYPTVYGTHFLHPCVCC